MVIKLKDNSLAELVDILAKMLTQYPKAEVEFAAENNEGNCPVNQLRIEHELTHHNGTRLPLTYDQYQLMRKEPLLCKTLTDIGFEFEVTFVLEWVY